MRLSKTIRDMFYLGLAQYSSVFFGFLTTIVLTRILTMDSYGKYNYIFSLLGFFVFLTLPGMTTPIMQAAANGYDKVLETGTKMRIKFSVLGSLCLLLFALFSYSKLKMDMFLLLIIAAVLFPFYICLSSYLYFLNGKRMFKIYFKYSFIEDIFIFAVMASIVAWTRSFWYAVIGILVSKITVDLFLYYRTLKLAKKNDRDYPDAKRLAGHYSVINFVGVAKEGYFEKILIGAYFSFAALAIYRIGEVIADQIKNLWIIIDNYIFPVVTKEEKSVARGKLPRRILTLLAIFIVLGMALIFCVQVLIPIFFTDKYVKSIPIAKLLIVSQIISVPGAAVILHCRAQKMVKEIYVIKSGQIVLYLILLLILIPKHGIMGIVWAIIISNFIYTLIALFLFFGKRVFTGAVLRKIGQAKVYIEGKLHGHKIYFIYDKKGWIIDYVSKELALNLDGGRVIGRFTLNNLEEGLSGKVVHFFDQFDCFNRGCGKISPDKNRFIGLWWHGLPNSDDPHIRMALDMIPLVSKKLTKIQVTNSIAKRTLLEHGVAEKKIICLPIGVNLSLFRPPLTESRRQAIRKSLGIPDNHYCIGLFQKDGVGWGEGLEPKHIKGPDIFLKVMEKLSQKFPIFALIPGPSRGFLKNGLKRIGVPCRCDGHLPLVSVALYYGACDLYIIPSRDEGGPAALLESMASGIPVVSTRVGMAADLLENGKNGFLVEVEDIDGLVDRVSELMKNRVLRSKFRESGFQTIKKYDWNIVAKQYQNFLYGPLLADLC
ncbi:MAG: glycosyltransferase [Candidatus Omnitrophica bacterium]|nr:glycosyltransferase [Candidatus Omnitrophota bacterium]